MVLLSVAMAGVLAAAAQMTAVVVGAVDSPVTIGRATVLTVAGDPPGLSCAATDQTDDELDQFTVTDGLHLRREGDAQTRQVAPGRRTLEPRSTQYSSIVLDGGPVDPIAIGRQPGASG